MAGFEIVKRAMLKELMKKGDDGIMLTLPKNEIVDYNAKITMDRLIKAGIDPESLTSSDQVLNILENINNQIMKNSRVISADSAEGKTITDKLFGKKGEVIQFPQKRTFKEEIDAMRKSGDIVDVKDVKISEKITDRDMFKNANQRLKGPIKGKTDAEIKAEIEAGNKKGIESLKTKSLTYDEAVAKEEAKAAADEDYIMKVFDPEDFAKGGRAGLYTGGMVDVEPNLSDIGHGSDALMARTRLVSPDGQATTSTGLNYLLAEDNDNIRVPFSAGGGGRRSFLKFLATLGGGIAGIKSGIIGLGEGGAKKAVTETVKQTAGSGGQVPPYFLNLVSKIKTLGDDTLATKDKAIAKKYKDYTMEEDFAGNIEIIKKGDDVAGNKIEDVYMSLKVDNVPVKGKKGSTKVEEYEEFTARPDGEGKMKDVEQGVPDEVVQEGTMFEDSFTDFGKAEGGRIGFSGGGIFRSIITKAAAAKGLKPYEFIKVTSYKSLPPEVKMFLSADDFAKLKSGQQEMYTNYIDMAKTRKNFQEQVEGGKTTPAKELFEGMEKTMDQQSYVPKTVTSDDIAQMELMVKNRFNRGRKDNAQGGLQTMLGE